MDPKELARLSKLRENCPYCGGRGYTEKRKSSGAIKIIDCKCVRLIHGEIAMIEANIPPQYRAKWGLKQLHAKFEKDNSKSILKIKKYKENIEDKIDAGEGLWIFSPPGLAKSSLICYLLKHAIRTGYKPYFGKASYYLSLKFQAMRNEPEAKEALRYIFEECDIIAVEEIEKVYLTQDSAMPNHLFYEFLSDLYDTKKAILVSSNLARHKFEENLPTFIRDRLKTFVSVPFFGKSGRKDRRSVQ